MERESWASWGSCCCSWPSVKAAQKAENDQKTAFTGMVTITVAAASEEMSASFSEIAQNSEKAREITGTAVSKAQDTSQKVNGLGSAAQAISKVTEVITEISEQTNLLVLNATIEAARAGEVGKGFAVVANEIKELAKQTADATLEIKNQIEGVQASTTETVADIAEVSQASNEMTTSSFQVNISAEELSRMAETINGMVGKFRVLAPPSPTEAAGAPAKRSNAVILKQKGLASNC